MGSNFRVALHGNGRVLDLLKDLIQSSQYPLEVAVDSADVWVSCDTGLDDIQVVQNQLDSALPVVLCSQKLIVEYKNELTLAAKENKTKIYLNSLFATGETNKYSLMNINEKLIKNIDNEEILKIKQDDLGVAKYLYQDILRAFNRWDPTYDQDRIGRENVRKEALKQNMYSIAKKLDVELESQPCGIDPKLPNSVEVNNVSNGNQ